MNLKEVITLLNNITNLPQVDSLKSFILDLQEKLSNCQEKHFALMEENTKLKTQIADYDYWDKEKQKYEITEIVKSTFVYRLKDTSQLFCPVCFNKNKVPIHLQQSHSAPGLWYVCPNCKGEFKQK